MQYFLKFQVAKTCARVGRGEVRAEGRELSHGLEWMGVWRESDVKFRIAFSPIVVRFTRSSHSFTLHAPCLSLSRSVRSFARPTRTTDLRLSSVGRGGARCHAFIPPPPPPPPPRSSLLSCRLALVVVCRYYWYFSISSVTWPGDSCRWMAKCVYLVFIISRSYPFFFDLTFEMMLGDVDFQTLWVIFNYSSYFSVTWERILTRI